MTVASGDYRVKWPIKPELQKPGRYTPFGRALFDGSGGQQLSRGTVLVRLLPEKYFDRPVRVDLGGGARAKVIGSTRAAAACLLYNWPQEWGQQHRAARAACIAVLKGEQPPEFARLAFIEAAREAGILVSS